MSNILNSSDTKIIPDFSLERESLDPAVLDEVRELAEDQGCAQEEMIVLLLRQALSARRKQGQTYRSWESLSQREKQVAALVCAGMTGRQIAARLVLSPETIKTHVRHILAKFGLNSRQDFRNLLAGWDFSRWLMLDRSLMIAEPSLFHTRSEHELYDPLANNYE
jgi:DNA-binding CsgD family transcriptional regulator